MSDVYDDFDSEYLLLHDDLLNGESYDDAERRILTKAADCLRNGVPTTFTGPELDLVRHLMPAHEVHQSGAVRWVLNRSGELDRRNG
jgi:hypothetical protein